MSDRSTGPKLGCGRDLAPLVDQIAEGAPAPDPGHQAQCPFCQDALVRLRVAHDALREVAGESVPVPRGLSARVLERLRRERRDLVIGASAAGRDTVSEFIVAQIARRAALAVDGVLNASVSTDATEAGVSLRLHLTAELGPPLPELADTVRDHVGDDVWALAGVRVLRVDVAVDAVD